MKNEIQIFFTALMFYTRIPCPAWVSHSEKHLTQSARYLPLVGWIVGGCSAIVLIVLLHVLPASLSIALAMAAGVLLTGAFHEDGLADTCDGFGGGWTKDKILTIMKDSRVGTFGVVSLVFTLLIKFLALSAILQLPLTENSSQACLIIATLLSAHSLSRLTALTAIVTHRYVRDDEASKAKPAVKNKLRWFDSTTLIAIGFGVAPLFLFQSLSIWLLIIPMYATKWLMMRFFNKWIGGYTGDCLGAIQQISEVVFYLGLLVLC